MQDESSFPKNLQQFVLVREDNFPPACSYLHHAGVGGQKYGSSAGSELKSEQHSGLDLTFPDLISMLQNEPFLHVYTSTFGVGVDICIYFYFLLINYYKLNIFTFSK